MNSTCGVPDRGFRLVRAVRMEDSIMWADYQSKAAEIKASRGSCDFEGQGEPKTMKEVAATGAWSSFADDLDSDINEVYLWHGTKPEAAKLISEDGFRVDSTHTSGTRFGA